MEPLKEKLPIEAVLPEIAKTFREVSQAVLVAPPGAGKSTRVPLFLLDEGFSAQGRMLVLEPRRMAARAIAERTAALRNETVGQSVGYQVRFDKCASRDTRILFITEGILTRRLISDPFLEGVGFVVLDEFHERSVHSDLALSFLKELTAVRDDLKLLVMSATLEAEKVSAFLGDCPVLKSEGRAFALTVSFAPRVDDRPLEVRAAAAVAEGLRSAPEDGDVLVFMPGEAEIRRLVSKLGEMRLLNNPEIVPLFGALPGAKQRLALTPGNRRRVVAATNIAETSLTIPKVTCVVDSGLQKNVRFDPSVGMDRLETVFISQSSATQRAGRAGRIAPGLVLRLWTAHEHKGRPVSDTPEMLRIDTAPVLLQLLAFHPGDPFKADLLDRPTPARLAAGLDLLERLGAIERRGFRLTPKGQKLAALPLHPRVGAILLRAEALGVKPLGAAVAALASERDILDRTARDIAPSLTTDFEYRLSLLQEYEAQGGGDRTARRLLLNPAAARGALEAKRALLALLGHETTPPGNSSDKISCGRLLLSGFPGRVAALRSDSRREARMVGGSGVSFPAEKKDGGELFVVTRADAGRRGAASSSRIHSACDISFLDLEKEHPSLLSVRTRALFNPQSESVATLEQTLFDDLVVAEKPASATDASVSAAVLAEAARDRFASVFSPDKDASSLIDRIRFAAKIFQEKPLPDVSKEGLARLLDELCFGLRTLDEVRRIDWHDAIYARLEYSLQAWLDREIPRSATVPSGSKIQICYEGADKQDAPPPHIACRMQELFGLLDTPRIAEGKVALVLHILAPNMRPCQVTGDLKSFWQNTYPTVRKELKGRYPKHYWPEDPFSALPTARVRPRGV